MDLIEATYNLDFVNFVSVPFQSVVTSAFNLCSALQCRDIAKCCPSKIIMILLRFIIMIILIIITIINNENNSNNNDNIILL